MTSIIFFLSSLAFLAPPNASTGIHDLFQTLDTSRYERPPYDLFEYGYSGYTRLMQEGTVSETHLLTLIDFRKPSNEKRLWVIDLENSQILFHTLVAHGRNSGQLYATHFSNTPESHESSVGFYKTGKIYWGKHGTSLILHGLEKGINDNALDRSIVIHGADYVSNDFINQYGRLGRSYGCPAIPLKTHKQLITKIAGGTCLLIYYPDQVYLATTRFKTAAQAAPISSESQLP